MLANRKNHYVILVVILILSGYVHLWNPVGFPDLFFDEGVYMRRAMNILENTIPQEGFYDHPSIKSALSHSELSGVLKDSYLYDHSYFGQINLPCQPDFDVGCGGFYDHPYFGQLVLSGFLSIVGFPDTVKESLELSYLAPRILMGLLAVFDTFLIYKITEKRFNKKAAILASILFGLMPITWLLRRIVLDTILLPLLLSSILLALHSKDTKHQNITVLGSSVLLGLAIFTKLTAITMIPVVAYIIITQTRLQFILKWLPGVFVIPMIWPGVALSLGQLDWWFRDVFWQASRGSGQFLQVTTYVVWIDPVIAILGFVSFTYVLLKRNFFMILWFAPFLIFVNFVGFFQYFHYILLLPVISISIALLLQENIERINSIKTQKVIIIPIMLSFVVYGLTVSSLLITTDMTSAQFTALEFSINNFNDSNTKFLASPVYTWILNNVYQKDNIMLDYADIISYSPPTEHIYLLVDNHYLIDLERDPKLALYLNISKIKEFRGEMDKINPSTFPYHSMYFTGEGEFVHIHTNSTSQP